MAVKNFWQDSTFNVGRDSPGENPLPRPARPGTATPRREFRPASPTFEPGCGAGVGERPLSSASVEGWEQPTRRMRPSSAMPEKASSPARGGGHGEALRCISSASTQAPTTRGCSPDLPYGAAWVPTPWTPQPPPTPPAAYAVPGRRYQYADPSTKGSDVYGVAAPPARPRPVTAPSSKAAQQSPGTAATKATGCLTGCVDPTSGLHHARCPNNPRKQAAAPRAEQRRGAPASSRSRPPAAEPRPTAPGVPHPPGGPAAKDVAPGAVAYAMSTLRRGTWRPKVWLKVREEALESGRLDLVVLLQQLARDATDKAVAQLAYDLPGDGKSIKDKHVDMRGTMLLMPEYKWFSRKSILASPKPSYSKMANEIEVSDACPMNIIQELWEVGCTGPIVLVVEAGEFDAAGGIQVKTPGGVWPQDLLVRTDFARFAEAANEDSRRFCHQASVQAQLTAQEDAHVLRCARVTLLRGRQEEGYPFLEEPCQFTAVTTANSTTRPHVSNVEFRRRGDMEWYAEQCDSAALIKRLNLLGELAQQERELIDEATGMDDAGKGAPPVLILGMPGSSEAFRHPRDAVAHAMKHWRRQFASCFQQVYICCRGRGTGDTALAERTAPIVNRHPAAEFMGLLALDPHWAPPSAGSPSKPHRRSCARAPVDNAETDPKEPHRYGISVAPVCSHAGGIRSTSASPELEMPTNGWQWEEDVGVARQVQKPPADGAVFRPPLVRPTSARLVGQAAGERRGEGPVERPVLSMQRHKSDGVLECPPTRPAASEGGMDRPRSQSCDVEDNATIRTYGEYGGEKTAGKVEELRRLAQAEIRNRARTLSLQVEALRHAHRPDNSTSISKSVGGGEFELEVGVRQGPRGNSAWDKSMRSTKNVTAQQQALNSLREEVYQETFKRLLDRQLHEKTIPPASSIARQTAGGTFGKAFAQPPLSLVTVAAAVRQMVEESSGAGGRTCADDAKTKSRRAFGRALTVLGGPEPGEMLDGVTGEGAGRAQAKGVALVPELLAKVAVPKVHHGDFQASYMRQSIREAMSLRMGRMTTPAAQVIQDAKHAVVLQLEGELQCIATVLDCRLEEGRRLQKAEEHRRLMELPARKGGALSLEGRRLPKAPAAPAL